MHDSIVVFNGGDGAKNVFGDNSQSRGEKRPVLEGDVRESTFIAGEHVTDQIQGKTFDKYQIHVTDWYPTLLSAKINEENGVDNSNHNDNNNNTKSTSNTYSSNNGDNGKNGNRMDIWYNRYILKNSGLVMMNEAQVEFGLKCAGNSDAMKNSLDILAATIVKHTIFAVTKKKQMKGKIERKH